MPRFFSKPDRPTLSTARRQVAAATALLVALLSLSACGDTSDTVVLGLAGPFTESYGASMQQGAELAAREINNGGGIRKKTLVLRALDDEASPERAVEVAELLFDDPAVVAVVGHVNSGAMIEAAGIYGQGLPALATSATSPAISHLGPWIFRVASSDSANAVALARDVAAVARRTAILYENDGYGRGLAFSFRDALLALGGAVTETSPYLPATADLTPYLERMRRQNVDAIFVAGMEDGAVRIIDQARRLGIGAGFVGGDGLEGLAGLGESFDGTRVGLLFHPAASAEAREFTERFRAQYGREPDSYAALGYDAVHLLAQAVEAAGAHRGAIRDYLASVGLPGGAPAFSGATGILRFDPNGDPLDKEFAIGTIRDGHIQLQKGGR